MQNVSVGVVWPSITTADSCGVPGQANPMLELKAAQQITKNFACCCSRNRNRKQKLKQKFYFHFAPLQLQLQFRLLFQFPHFCCCFSIPLSLSMSPPPLALHVPSPSLDGSGNQYFFSILRLCERHAKVLL